MSKIDEILKILRSDESAEKCDDSEFIAQLEQYGRVIQGIVNKSPANDQAEAVERASAPAAPEAQHASA